MCLTSMCRWEFFSVSLLRIHIVIETSRQHCLSIDNPARRVVHDCKKYEENGLSKFSHECIIQLPCLDQKPVHIQTQR